MAAVPHLVNSRCKVCTGLEAPPGLVDAFLRGTGPGEALCEALGLCASHSALLVKTVPDGELRDVLRNASEGMSQLLSGERRDNERLLALAFGAERNCPLCRLHEHRLATIVNHAVRHDDLSEAVCNEHYSSLAHAARLQSMASLTRTHAQLWDDVLRHLQAPQGCAEALPLLVGTIQATEASAIECDCVVCTRIVQAHHAWLASVRLAARINEDVWTVFPMCSLHVAQCVGLGDEALTERIVRYVVAALAQAMRIASDAIAHDNAKRTAASASVFYRAQSPAYVLGAQRRMALRVPHCPACERLAIMQTHAISRVLDSLKPAGPPVRLCVKHFAMTYIHTSAGAARNSLCAGLRRRLAELIDTPSMSGLWSCAMPPNVP